MLIIWKPTGLVPEKILEIKFIPVKKSQETKHWLRMLNKCLSIEEIKIKELWREAQELSMIFGKIASSVDKKNLKFNKLELN